MEIDNAKKIEEKNKKNKAGKSEYVKDGCTVSYSVWGKELVFHLVERDRHETEPYNLKSKLTVWEKDREIWFTVYAEGGSVH